MRTRELLTSAAAIGLVLMTLQSPAGAQSSAQFPSLRFEPAASPLNFFITESGQTLPHLGFSGGFYLHYAHRPLQLVKRSTDQVLDNLIDYQVNLNLLVALGLFDRFEVGLDLPIALGQSSDGMTFLRPSDPTSGLGAGVGDLRLIPKARIFTWHWLTLAASAPLSFPTGNRRNLLGSSSVTFAPRVIAAADFGPRVGAAVNVGYRFRNSDSFRVSTDQAKVAIDDEFFFSAAGRFGVLPSKLDLMADFTMALVTSDLDDEEVSSELLGGLRWYLPWGFSASAGAGPGLSKGAGTPAFRVFANLFFQYPPRTQAQSPAGDMDGDGITDDKDKCPRQPEDLDGYQDTDGCPDPDNDSDGILDTVDKCPLEPEDADGFEDADGCPDPDNDGDGILDDKDHCPLAAEDRDGFEDEDGCPDPDNDNDGITDDKDKCPNDPETVNGVEDDDGCPDTGKGPVQIQGRKITVPRLYFATGKDVILARSHPVLRRVAELLRKNTWIKKVQIEGHSDSRGTEEYNLDLSRRRAESVARFLASNGIDESRLAWEGFGESRPIASNATRDGRAANRRVELTIIDPAGTSRAVGQPPAADAVAP